MCAIFGWIDYLGIVSPKILNKLTQALANASEERGKDAAGIAYVQDGRISIYKRPKPAHKLKFKIPSGTKVVMGHTRFATQGAKENNYNNHPFAGRADVNFALAHNGVLYNDKWLRKERNLPTTNIETDSYVAVQLIESWKKLDFNSIRNMAEDVEGTFVFTILDEKNNMYFVKGQNPLTILHFPALGMYIYASTDSILSKALEKLIFKNFKYDDIETLVGDILRIDNKGNLQTGFFETYDHSKYFPFHKGNYSFGYYPWDEDLYDDDFRELTEAEENLIKYAEMNGVDSDIVYELLEFGFSIAEVEEMIYDTDYLDNSISYVRECNNNDNTGTRRDIEISRYDD